VASYLSIESIKHPRPNYIETQLCLDDLCYPIYFESNGISLLPTLDAYIPFSLLPMMLTGSDINAQDDLSERMMQANPIIQDIYNAWYPKTQQISLKTIQTCKRESTSEQKKVGTFFSAGVDSWYTLLKNMDDITDIIFVHGFDIRLDDNNLHQETLEAIEEIGKTYHKNVIEIKTNLRSFTEGRMDWRYGLGAVLASVGLTLRQHFKRIYIPATHTYTNLYPAGSHPILDHLWDCETLSFVHDGCEAGRVEKIRLIAQNEHALKSLRVCWKNKYGPYNCGKCEKCLRTMITLESINALERCPTFTNPLTLKAVSTMLLSNESLRGYADENLQVLKNDPKHQALYFALLHAVSTSRWKAPLLKKYSSLKNDFMKNNAGLAKSIRKIKNEFNLIYKREHPQR
jgi:hypothetical protein